MSEELVDNAFFTDAMNFSFSNIGTFEQCAYAWYLTYIEMKERIGNWYSDFGNLCHDIMEKYVAGEIDIFNLTDYFVEQYPIYVTSSEPPFPKGIATRYYDEMIEFFDNLDFDRNEHQVVAVEKFISIIIGEVSVIAKPDLVYVKDGKTILLDYKTSKPFKQNGKIDEKKIAEYSKQLLLYTYILKEVSDIKIDLLQLWFLRYNELVTVPFTDEDVQRTIDEFLQNVDKIKNATEYPPSNDKKHEFFCQTLCSVSSNCEFKPEYVPKYLKEFIPE